MPSPRIAKSLDVLRTQINRKCPTRKKGYDGWIGDAKHAARKSDHNPDPITGAVKALDITHDPANGVDCNQLASILVSHRDPRIKYIIWNGKIIGDSDYAKRNGLVAWRWNRYDGENKHDKHIHISVEDDYDSTQQWDLSPWDTNPEVPDDVVVPKEVQENVEDSDFGSLVPGGFYSGDPYNKSVPTSIRCNNPGALNTAKWVTELSGYVGAYETTRGNKTAIFRTPEQGVVAWWTLLKRYRDAGANTVREIISRYGGGQDYSEYEKYVIKQTGFELDKDIDLDNDDDLLKLGKAMFRYESGKPLPWSDAQILYGINLAQGTLVPAAAEKPKSRMKTVWGAVGLASTGAGSAVASLFDKLDTPLGFAAFVIILLLIGGFTYLIIKGRLDVQKIVRQLSGEE